MSVGRSEVAVGLSTASVYPEPAGVAFELAAELGYDGVEVMVWADPASQHARALRMLSRRYGVPVLAIHAPCLLITQRIWSPDPTVRLRRSVSLAEALDAPVVVLHPPFRWQRRYAEGFPVEIRELEVRTGVRIAVENMFPLRRGRLNVSAYNPSHDPTECDYRNYTLDLSHSASAQQDAVAMLERMGDRLAHLHLADGSGSARDEHLVPGRGTQPGAEVCERLARDGFSGVVVVEISTRFARTRAERTADLAEALLFARMHLKV